MIEFIERKTHRYRNAIGWLSLLGGISLAVYIATSVTTNNMILTTNNRLLSDVSLRSVDADVLGLVTSELVKVGNRPLVICLYGAGSREMEVIKQHEAMQKILGLTLAQIDEVGVCAVIMSRKEAP